MSRSRSCIDLARDKNRRSIEDHRTPSFDDSRASRYISLRALLSVNITATKNKSPSSPDSRRAVPSVVYVATGEFTWSMASCLFTLTLCNGPINTRPAAIITGRVLSRRCHRQSPLCERYTRVIRRNSYRGVVVLSAFLANTVAPRGIKRTLIFRNLYIERQLNITA